MEAQYSVLGMQDSSSLPKQASQRDCKAKVLSLVAVFTLMLISFWTGRLSGYQDLHQEIKLRTQAQIFTYNETFGAPPSNTSDAAWSSMFPTQGGYFRHPQLAEQRSALAVFHLLHCVDGLRRGYWLALEAAKSGDRLNIEELPFMASPRHVSHCIDLMRNHLMCYPDTTIEIKNDEVGGVTGFGTTHHCRDWDQLMTWMGEWEAYGQR